MPSAEPRWEPQPEPAVACEDPVFVLCAGRSGSTLVRFLLDARAGDCAVDTDWTVTGSAQAWQQVLSGGLNLGVAFRHGELRYADKGEAGAGSPVADNRVAMMAELLGVIRWQPARPGGPEVADLAQPPQPLPCG